MRSLRQQLAALRHLSATSTEASELQAEVTKQQLLKCLAEQERDRLKAENAELKRECERLRVKCGPSEMIEGDYCDGIPGQSEYEQLEAERDTLREAFELQIQANNEHKQMFGEPCNADYLTEIAAKALHKGEGVCITEFSRENQEGAE